MRDSFRVIARVAKAHGRVGEVVTVPVHGLPALVRTGLKVAVVPPELKSGRWHTVTSCETDDRAGQLVGLSGVKDFARAQDLVGRYLIACEGDLPDNLALHDARALVGRSVEIDRTGECGTIEEVMVGPANDVWVIRGPKGEVLVPVIDEVVSEVPERGPIHVTMPCGLTWEEGV